jgi:hypothetical protein
VADNVHAIMEESQILFDFSLLFDTNKSADSPAQASNKRRRSGESEEAYRERRKLANVNGQASRRTALNSRIDELKEVLGQDPAISGDKCSLLQHAAQLLSEQGVVARSTESLRRSAAVVCPYPPMKSNSSCGAAAWHQSVVAMFIADANFGSLDANSYLLRQLGYKPYEVTNSWAIMDSDTLRDAIGPFGSVMTGTKPFACLQGQLKDKSGEFHWWNGYITMAEKQGKRLLFGWMRKTESNSRLPVAELECNARAIPGVSEQFNNASTVELALAILASRSCVDRSRCSPSGSISSHMQSMVH